MKFDSEDKLVKHLQTGGKKHRVEFCRHKEAPENEEYWHMRSEVSRVVNEWRQNICLEKQLRADKEKIQWQKYRDRLDEEQAQCRCEVCIVIVVICLLVKASVHWLSV